MPAVVVERGRRHEMGGKSSRIASSDTRCKQRMGSGKEPSRRRESQRQRRVVVARKRLAVLLFFKNDDVRNPPFSVFIYYCVYNSETHHHTAHCGPINFEFGRRARALLPFTLVTCSSTFVGVLASTKPHLLQRRSHKLGLRQLIDRPPPSDQHTSSCFVQQ
jgi:hypothetical protein